MLASKRIGSEITLEALVCERIGEGHGGEGPGGCERYIQVDCADAAAKRVIQRIAAESIWTAVRKSGDLGIRQTGHIENGRVGREPPDALGMAMREGLAGKRGRR